MKETLRTIKIQKLRTIKIQKVTAERLKAFGSMKDTYDTVIISLLEFYENKGGKFDNR